MTLDGKKLAGEVLARAKARASRIGTSAGAQSLSHTPTLRVVSSGGNAATESYLKIKQKRAADAGVELILETLDATATTVELIEAVTRATEDALIVQLPLSPSVDTQAVLNTIPADKDADVLSLAAREKFERNETDSIVPPVAASVAEILKEGGVEVAGKRAVVIGNGWLVGGPVATWLKQHGADVTVATIETSPDELAGVLLNADIIVSGAGSAGLIKPEMIKEGVALIDAGTTESGGVIVGDAEPACADKCSLFTPVPGGVGPITVAKLFENVVELASRSVVA